MFFFLISNTPDFGHSNKYQKWMHTVDLDGCSFAINFHNKCAYVIQKSFYNKYILSSSLGYRLYRLNFIFNSL